jgi:hypothetical protein
MTAALLESQTLTPSGPAAFRGFLIESAPVLKGDHCCTCHAPSVDFGQTCEHRQRSHRTRTMRVRPRRQANGHDSERFGSFCVRTISSFEGVRSQGHDWGIEMLDPRSFSRIPTQLLR